MTDKNTKSIIAILNRIMETELAGVVRYTHYSLIDIHPEASAQDVVRRVAQASRRSVLQAYCAEERRYCGRNLMPDRVHMMIAIPPKRTALSRSPDDVVCLLQCCLHAPVFRAGLHFCFPS